MEEVCSLGSARGRWILVATLLSSGTAFLMGTAVAVALPRIQAYFETSITGIQWVVNAQLLALASLLLLGGSLGDRYGRKRIFMLGMSVFIVAALLSATAASTAQRLIAFQAVMGVGAALMIPQSLALLNVCFKEAERGQVIGLWAGLSGGIAALGPWLGGWVVEKFDWQAVFFIPVALLGATLVITQRAIPESRNPASYGLDWRGTLLILLGLFGIAYGLISGPAGGWRSAPVILSLAGGAVAVALFFTLERRVPAPLVPPQIFRKRLVLGANIVTFFVYFALNGTIIYLALNLEQVQGLSPAQAGLGLLPPTLIITFLSGPAGKLTDRIGPRLQMIVGPLLVSAGIALFSVGDARLDYFRHFLPGLILLGGGMALLIAPLTKSALNVESQFSGAASGLNNAVARIAALIAIAVLGAIMLSAFTAHLNEALSSSTLSLAEQSEILGQADKLGGIIIPSTFDSGAYQAARQAVSDSFVYAFRRAMGASAVMALAGAIVSARTIRNRPASRQ